MGTRPAKLTLRRSGIIGTLVALATLLCACSALRVAYATGPQLAWWWLDGYFDFERHQSTPVKGAIERWFDWHRSTQLQAVAATLVQGQAAVMEPTTPEAACRWGQRVRDLMQPALDRGLAEAAQLMPILEEPQIKHLEQKYAKNLEDMRRDYLQTDLAERQRESVKRSVDRAEQLYGRLNDAQRKLIQDGVLASPFDPQAWYEERQRRQRDTLHTLRSVVANKGNGGSAGQAGNASLNGPGQATRVLALKGLLERTERSPEPSYRAYQIKLTDYNCALTARIHNAAGPEQRRKAQSNLKAWESDLRAAAAAPPAGSDPSR